LDRSGDVNHGPRPEAILLGNELLDRGRHDVLDETNGCFPLRRIGRGNEDDLVSLNDGILISAVFRGLHSFTVSPKKH
jgi:hypothetical protein